MHCVKLSQVSEPLENFGTLVQCFPSFSIPWHTYINKKKLWHTTPSPCLQQMIWTPLPPTALHCRRCSTGTVSFIHLFV